MADGDRRVGPGLSDAASRPIATISRSAAGSTGSISWCCATYAGEEDPNPVRGGELHRFLPRQSRVCARQPTASAIRRWSRRRRLTIITRRAASSRCARSRRSRRATTPSQYATERLMIDARDGAKVPVSVVYRRASRRTATGKLFLYAYGAYGMRSRRRSTPTASACSTAAGPAPSPTSAAATTSATNGSSTASSTSATNTFNDFVDVAKGLIAAKFTQARQDRDQRRFGGRRADGRGGRIATPDCGARWSPTCRSSTCSTPCSTIRCR